MSVRNVIIIGAGPGGLAAAMLLSKAGARVTVLERMDRVGGRTSSIRENGFTFDLGPTFFLYPDVLDRIYRECGLTMRDEFEMTRLDPHYQLFFEGRDRLLATSDVVRMESELSRLSEHDAKGFRRYLEDNRGKFESFRPILERPFHSFLNLLDPRLIKLLPFFRPHLSVDGDLRKFFSDDRIRLACSFQSKYLGMSPYTCPSIFTILSYLEYAYGIFHPKGGCGAVSTAMADAARRLGADIRLNEEVTSIRFEGKRARSVVTAAGKYDCDALVINADFSHAMKKLVPNELRKRWSDEKIARTKYSCSTFMMYLGVNRTFDHLQHHNIFLSNEYTENLTDIERDHRLSANPSFYVCNPVVTDPTMAPPGKSALYVLAPVTHEHANVNWAAEQKRFRDLTMRQLAKIGLDGIEKHIEYERVLSPAGWHQSYAIHKGAVFNLAHSLDQMLHLRPQNRFRDLESVYLVGGGTHPGSGLPVIYESARISSALVARDLGLRS